MRVWNFKHSIFLQKCIAALFCKNWQFLIWHFHKTYKIKNPHCFHIWYNPARWLKIWNKIYEWNYFNSSFHVLKCAFRQRPLDYMVQRTRMMWINPCHSDSTTYFSHITSVSHKYCYISLKIAKSRQRWISFYAYGS